MRTSEAAGDGDGLRVLGDTEIGPRRAAALGVEDGRFHTHVIGATGSGKSTLLANLALADMAAGRGVVVIDPKGDLVVDLLARIPKRALERLVLIDPEETEAPPSLNVLSGEPAEVAVDHVVSVFSRIFAAYWGPRTDDVLRSACATLRRLPGPTPRSVHGGPSGGARRSGRTSLARTPTGSGRREATGSSSSSSTTPGPRPSPGWRPSWRATVTSPRPRVRLDRCCSGWLNQDGNRGSAERSKGPPCPSRPPPPAPAVPPMRCGLRWARRHPGAGSSSWPRGPRCRADDQQPPPGHPSWRRT